MNRRTLRMCVFQRIFFVPQPQYSRTSTWRHLVCLHAGHWQPLVWIKMVILPIAWRRPSGTISRQRFAMDKQLIAGARCSNCLFLTRDGQGYFCTLLVSSWDCHVTSWASNLKPLRHYGTVDQYIGRLQSHGGIPNVLAAGHPANLSFGSPASTPFQMKTIVISLALPDWMKTGYLYQQYSLLKLQKLGLSHPKWNGWANSDIRPRMFFKNFSACTEWKDTAIHQCLSVVWTWS
jgi:hypothetical protein